ncbi:MAG TPA: SpoIID/LytB domain-containing protein [Acidimicrobiales bacterium]|nr:SpoIID/LytB domain-containing protein [Acidimicrobiales bacterium]
MSGRGVWALAAALLVGGAALPASVTSWAAPAWAAGGVPVVQINGKGFGHGVGMAQDGELEMGRQGDSLETILGQFYPGTSLTRAGGTIRVVVLAASPTRATLTFPQGGQVQDAYSGPQSPGFPLKVPAGDEVIVGLHNGTYTASLAGGVSAQAASPAVTVPSTTTTTSPFGALVPSTTSTTSPRLPRSSTTTSQPAGAGLSSTTTSTAPAGTNSPGQPRASSTRPLWLVPDGGGLTSVIATGRRYRGVVEAVGAGAGGTDLDLVNQLEVEAYLRGMGEVQDPSWPLASLQAQAVIERTYALRAMQAAGEICDDTRCQVYLGQQAEYAAQDRAVSSTAGMVLAYQGSLAATVFSANAGGFTATPQEGFGPEAGDFPYLRAAPYSTYDPDPWSLTVSLADVASRLNYPGRVTSAAVNTTGPSGRALTVALLGSAGPASVSGVDFAASLGLRSTLFQLYDSVAAAAPAPPPPAQASQALPTDAAALVAAVATPVAVSGGGGGGRRHRGSRGGPAVAVAGGSGTGGWGWLALAILLVVAGAGGASAWRGQLFRLFRLFRRFAWTRRHF